jgi:hypothetical protein
MRTIAARPTSEEGDIDVRISILANGILIGTIDVNHADLENEQAIMRVLTPTSAFTLIRQQLERSSAGLKRDTEHRMKMLLSELKDQGLLKDSLSELAGHLQHFTQANTESYRRLIDEQAQLDLSAQDDAGHQLPFQVTLAGIDSIGEPPLRSEIVHVSLSRHS